MAAAEGNENDDGWIGRRIAHLRRERGWTLAALSERVGLSSTQLSRIENGGRQASLGTLIEIARAFGVSLSDLVADEPGRGFHVVRAADRTPRETANGQLTPLSGSYPGLEAVHLTISPAAESPSARHGGEEWLYVLSGVIEVRINDAAIELNQADAVHFPSHCVHSVRCLGGQPAEVLLVSTVQSTPRRPRGQPWGQARF